MAKGDNKSVKGNIETERTAVNDRYQSLYGELKDKSKAINTRSDEERGFLTDAYKSSSGTDGGLDPSVISNIRGLYGWKNGSGSTAGGGGTSGGGGSSSDSGSGGSGVAAPPPVDPYAKPKQIWDNFADTGGIDKGSIDNARGSLTDIAKTGGWDPSAVEGINGDVNRLRGIATDGGFNDARRNSIQGGIDKMKTYGDTGGYDPNSLAEVRGDIDTLRSLGTTGGYTPEALQTSRDRIGKLDSLATTGGMSAEDIAKFRGTGFSEFAETGGWSPEQAAEYRNRATSVIPAMYQQQMADANRLKNASGSNTGFLAGASRLGRQNAQSMATATRDAEVDLQGQIREGRRYGITGLQKTEKDLQDILVPAKTSSAASAALYGNQLEGDVAKNRLTGAKDTATLGTELEGNVAKNKINATGEASKLETDFQSAINSAMINASKGAGDLATNMQTAISQSKAKAQEVILENETKAQQLIQQGKMAGAQGLTQLAAQKNAEAAAARGAADSARASDQANDRYWAQFIAGNEKWIGAQQMEGRANSLRGLTSLYGMDPTLGRDNLNVNASSAWADDNRGLLGLQVQNQGGGKSLLDWAKFASGFIPGGGGSPGGSKPDVQSKGGGGGDSGMNHGWNPQFDFNPTPTPSTGGNTPSVKTSEEYRFPG